MNGSALHKKSQHEDDQPSEGAPDLDVYWAQSQIRPEDDHPDIPILPPYLFGAALLISLVFEFFMDGDLFRFGPQLAIGILVLSLGTGILAWCFTLFANEGTNIEPSKPATTLVTVGPYGFTRNPIYIGLCTVYIGLVVLFDITWGFVFFPLLILAVHYLVVVREEAYLEEKFGQKYRDYCSSVRRWF